MSRKRGKQHKRRPPGLRSPEHIATANQTLGELVTVCRVCGSTLNATRDASAEEMAAMLAGAERVENVGELLGYEHPLAFAPADGHAPEPIVSTRDLTKDGCDFCCSAPSAAAYVLKGKLTVIHGPAAVQQFGQVWTACVRCQALIDKAKMHELLERVMHFSPVEGMSADMRQQLRGFYKQLYEAWFQAEPKGPFPVG